MSKTSSYVYVNSKAKPGDWKCLTHTWTSSYVSNITLSDRYTAFCMFIWTLFWSYRTKGVKEGSGGRRAEQTASPYSCHAPNLSAESWCFLLLLLLAGFFFFVCFRRVSLFSYKIHTYSSLSFALLKFFLVFLFRPYIPSLSRIFPFHLDPSMQNIGLRMY